MAKPTESSTTTSTSKPSVTFKEIGKSDIKYVSAKDLKAGDIAVTGILLSSSPNKFNASKLDFTFEIEDGSKVVLNGAGNLQARLKSVAIGSLVQIKYNGQKKITKGPFANKSSHDFTVLLAG